jgi:hypothetical protein
MFACSIMQVHYNAFSRVTVARKTCHCAPTDRSTRHAAPSNSSELPGEPPARCTVIPDKPTVAYMVKKLLGSLPNPNVPLSCPTTGPDSVLSHVFTAFHWRQQIAHALIHWFIRSLIQRMLVPTSMYRPNQKLTKFCISMEPEVTRRKVTTPDNIIRKKITGLH